MTKVLQTEITLLEPAAGLSLSLPAEPGVYDVAIIGGGPAGLSAAQFAARAGLRTVILDKAPTAGALGLTSKIENYPGFSGTHSGTDLLDVLRRQAREFGAEYVQTQVLDVELAGGADHTHRVVTAAGPFAARALVVATGSLGRKAAIKGEEAFLGRGVSYCATCDAAFFRGRDVVVAGDTDEAVHEALLLARFARQVHLLSPRRELRVEPASLSALESTANVRVLLGHRVVEVRGQSTVTGVRVRDGEGREHEMGVSGVFIYLQGAKPIVDFLHGAVEVTESGCVRVDDQMQTSVPGVFAAGDVVCKEVRQAVIAAAEGARAALAADRYVHGRAAVRSAW